MAIKEWIEERDNVSINITFESTYVGFSRETWNGLDYDSTDGDIGNIDILFKLPEKEIRLTGTIDPGNIGIGEYWSDAAISLHCEGLINLDRTYGLDLEVLQPLIDAGVPEELIEEIHRHPSMDPDQYSVEISR
jgi:hypothetical protein